MADGDDDVAREAQAFLAGVDLGRQKVHDLADFVAAWVDEVIEVTERYDGDMAEVASAALEALRPIVDVLERVSRSSPEV